MTQRFTTQAVRDAAIFSRIEAANLTTKLILALLGTLLLTLSAKVQIPFWPVPMTMQTFVVLLIGMTYGFRLGSATVLIYLCEGAIGLPVFAGTPDRGIGLAYMAGPTGGFLFGFLTSAAAIGWLAERGWRRSVWRVTLAMSLGHLIILGLGFLWLASLVGLQQAWTLGVAPFVLATIVKTALGVVTVIGLSLISTSD